MVTPKISTNNTYTLITISIYLFSVIIFGKFKENSKALLLKIIPPN